MNIRRFASILAATAAVAAIAVPITAKTQSEPTAMQTYQQERADCLAGRTQQSQADCLYEARSVLRDSRGGNYAVSDAAMAAQSGDAASNSDALPPRADRN